MKNTIERRRHIRASLKLDLIIETPEGRLNGMTADISTGGLSIMLFLRAPKLDDEFDIKMKSPTGHEMLMSCKKVWSGKRISNEIVYDAIGVHFTKISPTDQKIISKLIEAHQLILEYKNKLDKGKPGG